MTDAVLPGPYGPIPVRVHRPRSGAVLPVVAYFHGGGWAVGSIDSFDSVARRLAAASGAAVVSVGYRLAPEHPFPAPVEEGLAVVRALGSDGRAFALAGDSAGGNLAAVISRRLRDERRRRVRRRATRLHARRDAELLGPLPRRRRRRAPGCLAAARGAARRPAAGARDHRRGGRAARRGRGVRRRPARRRVRTTLRRYAGTVHGFWRWCVRTEASVRAIDEAGAFLRGALAR